MAPTENTTNTATTPAGLIFNEKVWTLDEIMRAVSAKTGRGVFVRFDPFRDSRKFTVFCDAKGQRLADTDDPVGFLKEYLAELNK